MKFPATMSPTNPPPTPPNTPPITPPSNVPTPGKIIDPYAAPGMV